MKLGNRLTHSIFLAILLLAFLLCLTACQESTGSKYERANKLLTEGKYTEAAAIFDEISTYEDASKMSLYTKAINAAETGDYDTAFTTFASLGEFKDCSMMITYYMGRQNEASVYDGEKINGSKWFAAIEIYDSIPLFRDSKERAENCRKAAYDQAIKIGDEGDTYVAISVMEKLGTFSDAAKQITYYQAFDLMYADDYSGSSRMFSLIPGFRDADNRATSVLEDGYKAAVAWEEAGELDEANAIFLNLGDYKDSAERAYKLYYDAGTNRREAGDWDGARSAFTKAGTYSDAPEQVKETTYQEAASAYSAEEFEKAYSIYCEIKGYKDTDHLLKEDENLTVFYKAHYRDVGGVVAFGIYPQTKEGTDLTPIEWIVLDYDETNNKALLISKYGLDAVPYNRDSIDVTWEQCTLRAWLNGKFLNKAFSAEQQSAIMVTNVDNSSGQGYSKWDTDGGNNTQDRIFLLSYAEANRYLGVTYDDKNNTKSRVASTAYAIAHGAVTWKSQQKESEPTEWWWWLRSPGLYQNYAARVLDDGSLLYIDVYTTNGVVRPAFWLNLESDIF